MIIPNLKIGQNIKLIESEREERRIEQREVEYEVLGIYKYHVLLVNKKGIRRSITNKDLARMGYATQFS